MGFDFIILEVVGTIYKQNHNFDVTGGSHDCIIKNIGNLHRILTLFFFYTRVKYFNVLFHKVKNCNKVHLFRRKF